MRKIFFLVLILIAVSFKCVRASDIVDQMIKGIEYTNVGKYKEALSVFHSISHSDMISLHLCIGICYLNLGNLEEAVKEFELEIKLNPELNQSYYFLAMINEYQGNKEKAIYYWEKFVQLNKNEDLRIKALRHIKYLKGK